MKSFGHQTGSLYLTQENPLPISIVADSQSFLFLILLAKHQISNAMTAISTLNYLKVPEKHICEGLTSTYWPARLQKIENGSLYELITSYNIKNQLWVDGGHNEDASIQLKKSMNFIIKKPSMSYMVH